MTATQRRLILMALDRWKLARTIFARLDRGGCQNPREYIQALQGSISALDNLRTRIVAVLEHEHERELANKQLADTLSLSYLNSITQCEALIDRFRKSTG
jgi:hypothetical protein